MQRSSIEWTEATWNPVTGCTEVSPGCAHCYAKTFAERFRGVPGHPYENGFDLQLRPERLDQPLRWRKPRTIFVNSMSDLFHEGVSDEYIAAVFEVMLLAKQHRFQVLTKRSKRLAELAPTLPWPENVWIGVSVENQRFASRIDDLRQVPASVRFLSCEPLLGPIEMNLDGIDWVIAGGESGPNSRPMAPTWLRKVRDQCVRADVPFFFKQWGAYDHEGRKVGKKRAGRVLDEKTWSSFPQEEESRCDMSHQTRLGDPYGGDWTVTKLVLLRKYANAFTTALKDAQCQGGRFRLVHIDGFAGTGEVTIRDGRYAKHTLKGSARIALEVENRPFDRIHLIDRNEENVLTLKSLSETVGNSLVHVHRDNANERLPLLCAALENCDRALVFLDPFATEVEWGTVEAIAASEQCDLMLMFPASAVRRLLSREHVPMEAHAKRLDLVFGNRERWMSLYHSPAQLVLSEAFEFLQSDEGFDAIVECYRELMHAHFRKVAERLPLLRRRGSSGSQMFEFVFAATNLNGAELAVSIANDIIAGAHDDPEKFLDEGNALVLAAPEGGSPTTLAATDGQMRFDLPWSLRLELPLYRPRRVRSNFSRCSTSA